MPGYDPTGSDQGNSGSRGANDSSNPFPGQQGYNPNGFNQDNNGGDNGVIPVNSPQGPAPASTDPFSGTEGYNSDGFNQNNSGDPLAGTQGYDPNGFDQGNNGGDPYNSGSNPQGGWNATGSGGGGGSYGPIVLNLHGGPVKLTQLSQSNHFFNLASDGYQHLTAWAAAGNAVLFYDSTGKGQLTRADQVVFTDLDPGAKNDMQALEDVFDSNHDGKLGAGDAAYGDFFLEITNADGTTSVESLAQAGVSAINLTPNSVHQSLPDGSSIDGMTSYTTTTGGTGQAATVTFAVDPNGYAVVTTTKSNADGSTTIDNVASQPQGGTAFERILNTSANGLAQTLTSLNAGGNVLSVETDNTANNANGSTTETVTNYHYGTISATNRSGELGASVSTSGATKLNSTVTTTATSGGATTVTILRDQIGGGWTTQKEVDQNNSNGSSSITISDLNPDGSTSLVTTSTVSADGFTRTTTSLVDGVAADSTTSVDATVWQTLGAVGTETVTDKVGTSTVSIATTAISNHADTRVTSESLDGSGTIDLVSSTITTSATNAVKILQTESGRSGALMSAQATTTSTDGLSMTTQSDLNGAGTVAAPVWDLTETDDTTLYASGPWSRSVSLTTKSGNGALLSSRTTKYGMDGVSHSIVADNTGDGADDYVETVAVSGGVTTDTKQRLSGNGTLLSETVRATAADSGDHGQTVTTSLDAAGATSSGAPVFNLVTTDDTVSNADGSSTDTIVTTSQEGTVLDRKKVVVSANGLTTTTDDNFTGLVAGSWSTKTVDATTIQAGGGFTDTVTESDGYGNVLETVVKQTSADRRTITTTTTRGVTSLLRTVETVTTANNGAVTDTAVTFDKAGDVLGATVRIVSADGLTSTIERDVSGQSASVYASAGLKFDFVETATVVINADGSRATTRQEKSGNGTLLSTSTTTVSANGLTTTTIDNPYAAANYASRAVTATAYNADGGSTTTTSAFDYAGDLVDSTSRTVSGNGLLTTTTADLNGDGVVDRTTTAAVTINADGSQTDVVTDYTGGVTTGTVRDTTTTTTGVIIAGAGDETEVTRQFNGSVSYYQTETIAPSANGSDDDIVSTYASNGGALLLKTETSTSRTLLSTTNYVEGELVTTNYTAVNGDKTWDFWTKSTTTYNSDGSTSVSTVKYNTTSVIDGSVVTTSANGLSKTEAFDRTGYGDDLVITDNIVLNSDGSRTETVIDSGQDGSQSISTATTTSADGAHTTIARAFNGDGGQTETIVRQADGSVVDATTDANAKGATIGAKVTVTSGNGLSAITRYYSGGSSTTGSLQDTQSSSKTINADGSEQVSFSDAEASGVSVSSETTTSGNGASETIQSNLAEAFGVLLAVAELTAIPANGATTRTISDTLTPSGPTLNPGSGFMPIPGVSPINYTYKDTSVATTSASGLVKTYTLTDAGYGGVNLSSDIVMATDGSVTETLVAQTAPATTGQTDVVNISADGRTLQLHSHRPESGGLDFYEKVVLNADGTASSTNWDTNSLSALAFKQTRSEVFTADGGLTVTLVDSGTSGAPTDTTTQIVSPNGLSTTTTTTFASGAAIARTDVTNLNADGSRTETVQESAKGGATLANLGTAYERVTTTSADGRNSTTQVYGAGSAVLSEIDTTTVAADGSVVQTTAFFDPKTGIPVAINAADGTSANTVTTTISANGLVQTTVAGDLTTTTTMFAGTNGSYDWSEKNSGGTVVAAAAHVIDANQVDTWTSTSGGTIEIDTSSEAIAIGEATGLYYTILGRSLTSEEEQSLNKYIKNGVLDQATLAMALLASAEFTSQTKGASNSALATRLFENAFGTAPSSAQLAALNSEIGGSGGSAGAGLAQAAISVSELADAELAGSGLLQSLVTASSASPSTVAAMASPLQDLLTAGSAYEQSLGQPLGSLPASASALASAAPINIYSGLTGGPPTSATRIVGGDAVQSGADAPGWYEIGPFNTTPSYWYLYRTPAQQTVNFVIGTGGGVPVVIAPTKNQTINFADFDNSYSYYSRDRGLTIVYGGAGYDTFNFNQLGNGSGNPTQNGSGYIYIVNIPNIKNEDDLLNLNVAALKKFINFIGGVIIINPTASDVLQLDGSTIGNSNYSITSNSASNNTEEGTDNSFFYQTNTTSSNYEFAGSNYVAYFDYGAGTYYDYSPVQGAPNAYGIYIGVGVQQKYSSSFANYYSHENGWGQTQVSKSGLTSENIPTYGVNLIGFNNGVFGINLQGNGPSYYSNTTITTRSYTSIDTSTGQFIVPEQFSGNQNVITFENPGLPTGDDAPVLNFIYSSQTKLIPGKTVAFATVSPAKSGDVLSITQGPATGDGALSLIDGTIYYTAPSSSVSYVPVTFVLGDQNGNVGSYGYEVVIDTGPIALNAKLSAPPSSVLNLTQILSSLITPGLSGDVNTISAVTAKSGVVSGSAQAGFSYKAPNSGSDQIGYTVVNQLGQTAVGALTLSVTAPAGAPAIALLYASGTPMSAGAGWVLIGTVTPAGSGDSLTATLSSGVGMLSLGSAGSSGVQDIFYTPPTNVASISANQVSFTITDTSNGMGSSASVSIPLDPAPSNDPGPTANMGTLTVGHGQTQTITSLLMGLVTPGLPADTETLTAVTATAGVATLANNVATYTVPASGTATISYTVKDQLGKTTSNTVAVTVDPGPTAASGNVGVTGGSSYDITGVIQSLIKPGLTGDAETVSSVSATHGATSLVSGDATYVAPLSGPDTITYVVTDEYGDTARGSIAVTVSTSGHISVTAAYFSANIATLTTQTNVTAITLTDATPVLALSAGQIAANGAALGKITNTIYGITISDTSANVSANLAVLNANGHVSTIVLTGTGAQTLTLTVAQATSDATALGKITTAHAIAISDTSTNIQGLTSSTIATLGSEFVKTVNSTTASLALTAAQAIAFEAAGIGLSTVSGGQVVVSDSAAHLMALSTAQLSALKTIGVAAVVSGDTSVTYNAAQSAAIAAAGLFVNAPSGGQVSETFASGASYAPAYEANAHVVVTGSQVKASLASGDVFSVSGSADTINAAGANDIVTIGLNGQAATGSAIDTVTFAQGGGVNELAGSNVTVTGNGVTATMASMDTISLTGSTISLTASGAGDIVTIGGDTQAATNATEDVVHFSAPLSLTEEAYSRVDAYGNGMTASLLGYDTFGVYGSAETVSAAGNGDGVWIGQNGQSASGSNIDRVSFAQTDGYFFEMGGSNLTVTGNGVTGDVSGNDNLTATGSAFSVTVSGSGNTVTIGGDTQAATNATEDVVHFSAPLSLTEEAYSRVDAYGNGMTASLLGYDTFGVYGSAETVNAAGNGDGVWIGQNGQSASGSNIDNLSFAQTGGYFFEMGGSNLTVTGNGVTGDVTSNDTLTLKGTADVLQFGATTGSDGVNGFVASDILQFSKSNFANYSTLINAATQSGANTMIKLDSADSVTLFGVAKASLTSGEFRFV